MIPSSSPLRRLATPRGPQKIAEARVTRLRRNIAAAALTLGDHSHHTSPTGPRGRHPATLPRLPPPSPPQLLMPLPVPSLLQPPQPEPQRQPLLPLVQPPSPPRPPCCCRSESRMPKPDQRARCRHRRAGQHGGHSCLPAAPAPHRHRCGLECREV
jgi:hypothetical protein